MALDTGIWANALRPPKSIAEYDAEAQQQQANALGLQSKQVEYQNALQAQRDAAAYRDASRGFGADPTANANTLYKAGLPAQAAAVLKAGLDAKKTIADTGLSTAHAGNLEQQTATSKTDQAIKASEQHLQQIPLIQTHDDAVQWAMAHRQIPGSPMAAMPSDQFVAGLSRIPTDPQQLAAWKQQTLQGGMSATEQLKQKQALDIANQSNATSIANNTATNKTHLQAAGIAASTSRQNNAANIAKDYAVAGINPDGTPKADVQSVVDAIGQYKVAPPNGMALRNPRMQAILAQVTQQYPQFDATQYGSRQQAAKAWADGKQGLEVQATNTALNHLDTLRQLADAQANGNIRLFNQIANEWGKQTGNPAPTNLQGAVTMVGPEISKAVVGSGGGVSDREKVDSALSALIKGGPAQASGQIATMQDLFGGRLQEKERSYQRNTGRSDFRSDAMLSPAAQRILATRGNAAPAATAPTNAKGWTLHQDAKGNKAYVSPDGKQYEEVK